MNWDIKEFIDLSQRYVTPSEIALLKTSLSSLQWKIRLCNYHKSEYQRILSDQLTGDNDNQLIQAVGKILMQSAGMEEGLEFLEARLIAEAHVIAFAQSLHSMADILAHLLHAGLKLEAHFKAGEDISLAKVLTKMKKHTIASTVAELVDSLCVSDEFKYLSAYVNVTKHISLVPSNYSINFEGDPKHGLRMKAFTHKINKYDPKWADEFTGADYQQIIEMIKAIGYRLNEYMKISFKSWIEGEY